MRWTQAPIWSEWVKLTRLQWSARFAFEREVAYWRDDTSRAENTPDISDGGGSYRTSVAKHLSTLSEPSLFYELLFLRSFSLVEGHCKLVSHICHNSDWALMSRKLTDKERDLVDGVKLAGGVEAWSTQLISDTSQRWQDVYGGLVGLIEISIIRNAIMHGYVEVSGKLLDDAKARGVALPYIKGDHLTLSFQQLHVYRGRMRSLCRILSDGVVHLERGTHRERG